MARKIRLGDLTLSWHRRNRQWRKSIGFKPDKAGERRVPAEFYFGTDEAQAFLAAAEKIREWDRLVDEWGERWASGAVLFPKMDPNMPFWIPIDLAGAGLEEAKAIVRTQAQNVSVGQAQRRYLEHLQGRLGLMGSKGLKQSTYNTLKASLALALRAMNAGGHQVLPPEMFIHLIDYSHVSQVITFHYRKGALAERSALNYCRAFQSFLEWMDSQPDLRFRKPKGTDALFKLGKPEGEPKVPTIKQAKAIYAAARDDHERLYVLLGINCGMYEADIAGLTPAAIIAGGRERYMWWRRSKTSHQNRFFTLHWLFPETLRLIEVCRAKDNPHGRLLLNRRGLPIAEDLPGYRTKAISDLFPQLLERAGLAGVGVSFKSLRKFGANEVRSHAEADGDNLARMYLGQKIPGVLRAYVKDDFAKLTAALKLFRGRLIGARMFPSPLDSLTGPNPPQSSAALRAKRVYVRAKK